MTSQGRVALVLCGGGSKGAVTAGFVKALEELRVPIGDIVGTSIGALNGAFIAAGMPALELAELWSRVRFSDLFAFNWNLLRGPSKAVSLYSNRKLRRFLERYLPPRFEDLALPLAIVGADLCTGEAVLFEKGSLIDAVLGSTALPGLLPPVTIGNREIIDGGVANSWPLDVAAERGADLALVLRCGCRRPLVRAPRGIAGVLSRAFDITLQCQAPRGPELRRGPTRFVLFEPCLDEDIGLLDFSRSAELVEIGYRYARTLAVTLADGAGPRALA